MNTDHLPSLAISTERLCKRFGSVVALEDINLTVPSGAIYGLLGPNGAGKSTTLRILNGLQPRSAGHARVLGLDPEVHPLEVKRGVGTVPEGAPLFEALTGLEQLLFCGRIYGIPRADLAQRIQTLLSLIELTDDASRPVASYSTGMRKKLALACALLHGPRLLLLDEPFENLDPSSSLVLSGLMQSIARDAGTTVFISSHSLDLIDRIASHVGVIKGGRLLLQGSLAQLTSNGRTLESLYFEAVGSPLAAPDLNWFAARPRT